MKRTYTGLSARRMTVESQPLLQNSQQKIKAKTKVKDWEEEEVKVEMGIDNMTLSNTPIAP